jgi:hypothetical protein
MDKFPLTRESGLDEVFAHVEHVPVTVVLYIDQSKICETFTKSAWVLNEHKVPIQVVEVDQEIVQTMQIGKVPQFRFYRDGNEVGSLVGTVEYGDYSELRERVFGNAVSIQKQVKND